MDFWIYIYAYNSSIYTISHFEIYWDLHNRVEIIYSAPDLMSRCYPGWDEENKTDYTLFSTVNIYQNIWVYIRCSASQKTNSFFHKTSGLNSMTNPAFTKFPKLPSTKKTTLTIAENSPDKNYGVLNFQQIRLWKCDDCLKPMMMRMPVQPVLPATIIPSTYPDLLHVWNPDFFQGGVGVARTHVDNPNMLIKDLAGKSPDYTPKTNSMFFPLGYNEYDPSNYIVLAPPTICVAGSLKCLNVPFISDFNDVEFTNVPVSYSGQYTMEFWLKFNQIAKFVNGFNIVWVNHMAISMIQDYTNPVKLYQMLFPQENKTSPYNKVGQDMVDQFDKASNKDDEFGVNPEDGVPNPIWIYFRAGVSFSNSKFYLYKQNGATTELTLSSELLYKGSYNPYPSKYFFQDGERTKLIINKSFSANSPVLLRTMNLYTDYLPPTYLITNQ